MKEYIYPMLTHIDLSTSASSHFSINIVSYHFQPPCPSDSGHIDILCSLFLAPPLSGNTSPITVTPAMAPRSPQKLPYSEEAWKEEANSHKVPSIHDFEVTRSASKITFPQYIALKTIWKGHNINTLTENDEWPRRFGSTRAEILKKATEMKQDDKTWYNYLKALETPQNQQQGSQFKRNLGCFAMALQNQRETKALIETKLETQKVVVSPSPIAFRTRSKGKAVEPIPISFLPSSRGARTPSDHSSSPERQGRSQDRGKGSEFRSPSDASEAKSQASVLSTVDFEMSKEDRDSTVDEQVVNTAAITFLQSLFIYDDHQKAVWSAQRKGFCLGAGKGKTAFKAITDGHFRLIDEQRSAAILEVKARKRLEHSDFSIEMQETAQMALWIYEEPSSYWTSRQHPSTCQ